MAGLILWKTEEMNKLRRDMDRMLRRLAGDLGLDRLAENCPVIPAVELSEIGENFVAEAFLGDVDPGDIEVTVTPDTLTIRRYHHGRTLRDGQTYRHVTERFGRFLQSLSLPSRIRVEETYATLEEGVLRVVMPKVQHPRAGAVKIHIQDLS